MQADVLGRFRARRRRTPFGLVVGDSLFGEGGDDQLDGPASADCVYGDAGNDELDGGSGGDLLVGGFGNDRIGARDGVRDRVDCGPGQDVAIVDVADRVKSCEKVRRPNTN